VKIVLAFDSFKGSLSAREACDIVAAGIHSVRPDVAMVSCPMADGGEGTVEVLRSALGGEWIPRRVTGPLFSMKVDAGFSWLPEEKIAGVEMAMASGLLLLNPENRNPMETTTFGTGELIHAAIKKGARKIRLTVGGSATLDGGLGAASALGWQFMDTEGLVVPGSGKGLGRVAQIIPPVNGMFPEMDVLCDVTNPLCGPNGAAQVYGPQKGATLERVQRLDSNLRHFSDQIGRWSRASKAWPLRSGRRPNRPDGEGHICDLPGAGAAGGLAAGAVAFMNGSLVSGVDAVMKLIGLASRLVDADWVLTGEGCFDRQSIQGKVVEGVARQSTKAGAKTGVIAGKVQLTESQWRAAGIEIALALQPPNGSTEETIFHSRELLFKVAAIFAQSL